MAFKTLITKEEFAALPEVVQKEYNVEGDGYILDTDDSALKSKIGEFRSNNNNLMKQHETLTAELLKFKDIDPEKAREAAAKLQKLEEDNLLEAGNIDEVVMQRTERMRTEGENKYNSLNDAHNSTLDENAALKNSLRTNKIESKIALAVGGVGTLRKGALTDVLARAHNVWQLDDSQNLVAKKGDDILYGEDGKTPMTTEEYATQLLQDAPHMFEGSSGSDASGNDGKKNNDGKTVVSGDREGFAANIEGIASGAVKVAS